jgi:hypothetical protein
VKAYTHEQDRSFHEQRSGTRRVSQRHRPNASPFTEDIHAGNVPASSHKLISSW